MLSKNITTVIPTYNYQHRIKDWLRNVKNFSKISVIDYGSTDTTLELCKEVNAKIITLKPQNHIYNFDWARLRGMSSANTPWIMKMDGDERLTTALKKEIKKEIQGKDEKISAIGLRSRQIFFGHEIKFGHVDHLGYELRIFRSSKWHYFPYKFHQQIYPLGQIKVLKNKYLHFNYSSLRALIEKNIYYIDHDARINYQLGERQDWKTTIIRPFLSFFKLFIKNKGYKDKTVGLIVSMAFTLLRFIYYVKIFEVNRKELGE